jgi:hypothetical protein
MELRYKIELGVLSLEARLDDSGVFLLRGPKSQQLRWDEICGAALLRNMPSHHQDQDVRNVPKELNERATKMLGGPEMLAKMHAMQERFETISFGYRDARGHRKILDFPIPADDPRYLQEISSRLGSRWLGEVPDRHQAEKKLGTAPGFLKLAFVLIAVLLIIALVAVFGFFTALGPAFHFLSVQRMLLDLQDGEYASFGTRLFTYVALFVFALLLRRWWRGRMAQRRARTANTLFNP